MKIITTRVYTDRLKAQVLQVLENGKLESYEAARRKYGIQGNVTVANWARKSGKTNLLHKSEVIDVEVL